MSLLTLFSVSGKLHEAVDVRTWGMLFTFSKLLSNVLSVKTRECFGRLALNM